MDLIKSIEKAKKARQEVKKRGADTQKEVPFITTDKEDAWQPPVYSESRKVDIDRAVAEKMRCVCLFPDTSESDFYNVVRTQIQNITQDYGWKTVMFTSTQPGEGKTVTCINLALSFAKTFNQTVLLVDNDLKRQKVHRYLGIRNNSVGLIDCLTRNLPLKDAIVWPGIDKLALISGGKTISSSSELMNSPRMKKMVEEMKTRYEDRHVFFDTPPLLGGADAMTFVKLVDCVVMVVEAERTSTDDIRKARELIPDEKFMGFILNRQKTPLRSYYKYYSV